MIRFNAAARQARAQALIDVIAGAGPGARLRLYAGALPASIDEAVTDQTLLADVLLAAGVGTAGPAGTSFADVVPVLVLADGIPSFVRVVDAAGTAVLDLDCGPLGGSAHFQLAAEAFDPGLLAGSIFDLAGSVLTEP